jgi:hypothetical protein
MSTAALRRADRPTLNLVLLGLTLVSTFCVYFLFWGPGLELYASPQLGRARED